MAECKLKPYCTQDCNEVCNGDCNECKYKETIEGAVIQLKKALFNLIEPIVDAVNQFTKLYVEILKTYDNNRVAHLAINCKKKRIRKKNVNQFTKLYFTKLYVEILKTYDNNRVAHLAINCKKKRIRKKNRNRIMKWIGKGGKDNGGN